MGSCGEEVEGEPDRRSLPRLTNQGRYPIVWKSKPSKVHRQEGKVVWRSQRSDLQDFTASALRP